jgi:hypothetical protein
MLAASATALVLGWLVHGSAHVGSPPQQVPRARAQCATPDPFRSDRPPIAPMVINAIQDLLGGGTAEDVAAAALQARSADPDYSLTAEEEKLLTRQVQQTDLARGELVALLEAAVSATPWVEQFGAAASFGVGDAADPYVRASRAECMLAALVLHADGGDVDFIDEDRLEVLRDSPPAEAVDDLRRAIGRGGGGG